MKELSSVVRLLRKLPIRLKLVGTISVLLGSVAAFITLWVPHKLSVEYLDGLNAEALTVTRLLSFHLAPGVEFEDVEALSAGLSGLTEGVRDIEYLAVTDERGELLKEHGRRAEGGEADSLSLGVPHLLDDGLWLKERIRNLEGRTVGHLLVRWSLRKFDAKQQAYMLMTVGVGALLLIMGAGIAFALNRMITAPLSAVTASVRQVSGDALGDISVPETSEDEIGELAAAFNRMVHDLRRTTVSKGYVDNILGSMLDMLLVVDRAGTVRTVNGAACDALGYHPDDLVGKPLQILLNDDCRLLDVVGEANHRNIDASFRASDGAWVPTTVNASVMRTGAAGVPSGLVLIGRDMRDTLRLLQEAAATEAERRKAEELREAYAGLEQAHGELKRAQAQLVQSGKLAGVGELAAGVAHEMNNPLSVVLTYAIMLDEKLSGFPEHVREPMGDFPRKLGMIKIAAERCKSIADNLLAFSRQSKEQMRRVCVASVLEKTFDLIGVHLRHAKVKLKIELPQKLHVWGNDNELQQIITNIALNGAQAMENGGELKVTTRRDDEFALIEIADTGRGIPAEQLDSIFDPFFTTKPVGKGTGLGLSIAYGIVERHRGQISVESAVGEGTTFRIRLPMTPEKRAAAQP